VSAVSDQKRPLRETIHPVVFPVSAVIIVGIVIFAAVAPNVAQERFTDTRLFLEGTFGWFYILVMALLLITSVFLIFSPYARIKLGPDDSVPDYSTPAWFAMLFSAGMGIGLVFWGVAEPVYIAGAPPRAEPGTMAAEQEAMNFVFHHWGFNPWAIYAIIGLGLAYFGFRRGLPMTIRSLFQPLLGDRVNGPIGHAIDVIAVVATMFGIATSLGLGVTQVAAGLGRVFGWEPGNGGMVLLIAVITAFATISVMLGLDKGIKILSQINIAAAALLAAAVLLLGPTLFLLIAFVDNTGSYLQNMIDTLLFTGAYGGEQAEAFLSDWTIFYWAWWISWSPFVGMFIARVSYGRTVREFVTGVLLAPTLVSFAWFTIFGNTALGIDDVVDEVNEVGEDVGMFALLENLGIPGGLATALSILTIFVVVVFFVTSSDSGSFVIDMLTSGGDLHPAVQTRVFWAITEGAVAAALLLAGGTAGLEGLQAGAVAAGFPFAIVLVFATWSLLRGLRSEVPKAPRSRRGGLPATIPEATRQEREQRARELELKAKELDLRAQELEQWEEELATTGNGGSGTTPPTRDPGANPGDTDPGPGR
jgi:choline/glycine/proline betaine transport protein